MKMRGTTALMLAIVSAALIATALLVVPRLKAFGGFSLLKTEETVTSNLTLDRIVDLAELQTVSGVYQIVFPHDYYHSDRTPLQIIDAIRESGGTDRLPERERTHLDAYNIAREVGLGLDRDSSKFVVLTAVVVAGYDLGETADRKIQLSLDGREFAVPPPEILDVRIEDLAGDSYGYPPVLLSPEELRMVAVFVEDNIASLTTITELFQTAQEQAVTVLSALFDGTQGDSIRFVPEPLAIPDNL